MGLPVEEAMLHSPDPIPSRPGLVRPQPRTASQAGPEARPDQAASQAAARTLGAVPAIPGAG
jgi:hypothetical protein